MSSIIVFLNLALGTALIIGELRQQHAAIDVVPSTIPSTLLTESTPINALPSTILPILPTKPTSASFEASSVHTDFGMVGTVSGVYRVLPNSVEVTITEGRFWYDRSICEHQACTFDTIQVGLGYSTDPKTDRWNITGLTLPRLVDITPDPDDVYELHNWTFTVPITPSFDLTHSWIVFRLGGIVPYPDPDMGYYYIHSDELDVLQRSCCNGDIPSTHSD
jgi:hypothetical protein